MNQCLVQPYKGVCATRMPDPALCRIALVRNPDMRRLIIKFVIGDYILRVANNLQDRQVLGVAQHESTLLTKA